MENKQNDQGRQQTDNKSNQQPTKAVDKKEINPNTPTAKQNKTPNAQTQDPTRPKTNREYEEDEDEESPEEDNPTDEIGYSSPIRSNQDTDNQQQKNKI